MPLNTAEKALGCAPVMRRSLAWSCALLVAACGGSSSRDGFDEPDKGTGDQPPAPAPAPSGDFDHKNPPPSGQPAEIAEVFGHSDDTLYRLDPETKNVSVVGQFSGCAKVIDIALTEGSKIYATSYQSLYEVDKATAKCTEIAKGSSFPNSLSFVPKGTLDPNEEALVGYVDADYVRIDTKTGAVSKVGTLGDANLVSSGDVVSVKGGATYLTVKSHKSGTGCEKTDCLVEIDPTTGKIAKRWGSIEHSNVFGLSFWAGKIYGFDDTGELFEVTFGSTQLATKAIGIPQKPSTLSFWGAGSTTSAPVSEKPQ